MIFLSLFPSGLERLAGPAMTGLRARVHTLEPGMVLYETKIPVPRLTAFPGFHNTFLLLKKWRRLSVLQVERRSLCVRT